MIDEELALLVREPTHAPSRATAFAWTVCVGTACTLRLLRLPGDAADNGVHLLGSSGHRLLALAVPQHRAQLALYRHDQGDALTFDTANRLSDPEFLAVDNGDVVALEAWRDVAEWLPQAEPRVAAVLLSPAIHAQHWVYRRETLCPIELVSTTFDANRLQYALELLAEIGDASHAPAVAAVYTHAAHHVRWAAVKAVLDLDRDRGLALLREAVDDLHPHVARAAARGLQVLESTTTPWH